MSKRTYTFLIFAALVLLFGCQLALADEAPPAPTGEAVAEPVEVSLSVGKQEGHPALMTVNSAGHFQPFYRVTTADVCESLYPMLNGLSRVSARDDSLDRALWADHYRAAALLHNAGVLSDGQSARPGTILTRGELSAMLERLAGCFSGEEARRATTIAAAVAAGETSRDGTADPADIITRAEFAVVLVQLAGREPDETALFLGEYLPVDVGRDNYAWSFIADALTAGVVEPMESGTYRAYGGLYAVDENGELLRDMDYGVWTFGADGRYTTGDAELDGYLEQIISDCGVDDLGAEEALEKVYLHVKYNYEYLVTPADMTTVEPADTGWENERALRFYRNGGGTCYGFAAGFGLLARALGEHAYIVSAQVNEYYAPHGFVVIPEDGVDWIYDVEMEATRQERHKDLELFCIKNREIYNYWYTPDW